MAQRGRPIPADVMARIQRLRTILSVRKTAREADVSTRTVQKYQKRS